MNDRLGTSDLELSKVRRELTAALQEAKALGDENHRLKNTIVNKDSQNETL